MATSVQIIKISTRQLAWMLLTIWIFTNYIGLCLQGVGIHIRRTSLSQRELKLRSFWNKGSILDLNSTIMHILGIWLFGITSFLLHALGRISRISLGISLFCFRTVNWRIKYLVNLLFKKRIRLELWLFPSPRSLPHA